jgi:general secretion pathway protein A
MYLEYYGLKREPFHITPDPSFLYLSPSHKEALGAIIYGVEKRKGFIAIIGEVGVGKTSILRAYLERKASRKQKTIYIFNPVLSFHDLLISMFRSLELTPRSDNIPEMVNQLHEALIAEYQAGGTVVVAIDEAQNMPVETLENLRMFSNLETPTDKLIQIILLGQPELDNLLQQASLRQLKQRIALWAVISPLTREESQAFIEHRIARACTAGGSTMLFSDNENSPTVFTKSALNLIARKGEGIPRRINILCDNALITGFGRQCKPVSVSVVREILGDIDTNRAAVSTSKFKWVVGFSIVIIFIVGLLVFFDSSWRNGTAEILSSVEQTYGKASSSKGRELRRESIAIVGQQTHNTSTSESADTVLSNSDDSHSPSNGFHEEPSGADARTIVDVSSLALVKARSEERSRALSNQGISKSDTVRVRPRAVQENERSGYSGGTVDRKPVRSSGGEQTATHDKVLREGPGSERRATIALAQGNATREVRKGESLSQIILEAYGSHSREYIKWVKQHNPQIVDPDIILPGQQIVLPTQRKK